MWIVLAVFAAIVAWIILAAYVMSLFMRGAVGEADEHEHPERREG